MTDAVEFFHVGYLDKYHMEPMRPERNVLGSIIDGIGQAIEGAGKAIPVIPDALAAGAGKAVQGIASAIDAKEPNEADDNARCSKCKRRMKERPCTSQWSCCTVSV